MHLFKKILPFIISMEIIVNIIQFFKFWTLGSVVTFSILNLVEKEYATHLGGKLAIKCALFWPSYLFNLITKKL